MRGTREERAQLRTGTLSLCDLLKRFLIFGNKKKELKCLALERILRDPVECIKAIDITVEYATEARVPEMQPLMYAYARLAHRPGTTAPDIAVRKYALQFLSEVCKIPTNLFMLLSFGESWGELKKNAVRKWYTQMDPGQLAFLITKYQHRQGWRHKDVLALMHLRYADVSDQQRVVFRYIKDGVIEGEDGISKYLKLVHRLKVAASSDEAVACIEEAYHSNGPNLVFEHVPSHLLNLNVWRSMLLFTGLKRLISSMHLLTIIGLFEDDTYIREVTRIMTDAERIRRSKLHPMSILVAWRTYTKGRSMRGNQTWVPHESISSALEAMFYASFDHVEPTGLRLLYALDISGSMGMNSTKVGLTCLEVMMCFVMVMLRVEKDCTVVAFCNGLTELSIDSTSSLHDLLSLCGPGGSTDCCLPFEWSRSRGETYDAVVMWTDNDHNGQRNPKASIESYRNDVAPHAKAVVIAMDGNRFNLLPSEDPLSLNLAGGDAAMPQQLNGFLCM